MKRYIAVLEIEDDVEIVGDIEAVANYTYRDNGTNYAYTESVEFKLEQEPCDDCVSRSAVLDLMQIKMGGKELYKAIYELPPVIPKREQGKWIQNGTGYDDEPIYKCSQCGKRVTFWEDGSFNGCPYCFAEMKGVKE